MIRVTFGEHDRCNETTRPETRFVLRAFVQDFSFTNFDKDIALLRLNDRVPITDFIRPICLPNAEGEFVLFWILCVTCAKRSNWEIEQNLQTSKSTKLFGTIAVITWALDWIELNRKNVFKLLNETVTWHE